MESKLTFLCRVLTVGLKCRDMQPERSNVGFLTPNKGIRTPESLGRSRMIFLEVLKGFLCIDDDECWLLTLDKCCD